MGPIGRPETSVRNYHYSLRNNPEERSSQLDFISSNVQHWVQPIEAYIRTITIFYLIC